MKDKNQGIYTTHPQRIVVFQQRDSAQSKIAGVKKHGRENVDLHQYDIPLDLPPLIDNADQYLPADLNADLVLDYLKHPDLSEDLADLCAAKGIPVVASGKKIRPYGNRRGYIHTPPTCCGLSRNEQLGWYGRNFGAPEFLIFLKNGRIAKVEVVRGAPCGATWDAAEKITGLTPDEALIRIGLETQYVCTADPSNWDPFYGKSPVHFAADVHAAALKRALEHA
jgi:hypothetical protein